MNPAFAIGQTIGNNLGESFKKAKDENAIDKVLKEAMNSGDPKALQQGIGQILSSVSQERQPLAVKFLESRLANIQAEKQKSAVKNAGFDPDIPIPLAQTKYKSDQKNSELSKYGIGNGLAEQQNAPQPQMQAQKQQDWIPGMQMPDQPPQAPKPGSQSIPDELKSKVPSRPWFKRLSRDQLTEAQGSPYKEISEPAKAEALMQDADKKDLQYYDQRSQKFDDELRDKTRIARQQLETVKDIDKAIASGNVSPSSFANIFKGMGVLGDKVSQALLNKDESLLQSSIPQLLEGWKEVFGVRLSDADLKLLGDKLPSIGKTPEANRAVLGILKKYADMTLLRGKIGADIKKEYKGLRPLGYEDMIEERYGQMTTPVKIINPTNGKEIEIPAYRLSEAIEGGAKLANG